MSEAFFGQRTKKPIIQCALGKSNKLNEVVVQMTKQAKK
jgi:hypothetical protein